MRSYGSATLSKGYWLIKAEPHVMIRLKRVFAGINPNEFGEVHLMDTLNVCRDLQWFTQRYPLRIDPLEYLELRADQHRDRETVVAKLLAGKVSIGEFKLAIPPRDYQRKAAELALSSRGLLVADDLGLGKTVIAICFLSDPRTRPALVVCPSHLQRQWKDEIQKFAPKLEVHRILKTAPYDYTARKAVDPNQLDLLRTHPDVLIITPNKLSAWAETLSPILKSVVFDEVHEYRAGISTNKGAAAAHVAMHVDYRLGLSATPIFNYGGEIWNVLDLLQQGILGTEHEFRREWCGEGANGKPSLQDPQAFGLYARELGVMIRRTRAEVGRELPELIKSPQAIDCDAKALDAVADSAYDLAKIILAKTERALAKGEQFRAGGQLDSLIRQATGIAKAPHVADFVRLLLQSEEKVVLFGWHREVYDIWMKKLAEFNPVLYTGTESEKQKDDARKAFIEGKSNLLIVSLRSGSGMDGLQYSGCRTVVFGELDWSPAVHEQCAGRVHRDGQKEPVLAYYLISDGGADPIIADVLGVKKAQLEGLRDPHGPTGLERLDTGGAHIRRLAEEYINKKRSHLSVVTP